MPFFGRPKDKLNILLSLHRDGEIVARAGRRMGLKFIRGSGDHGRDFHRKKAVEAFTTMLRLLKRGESVVTTADVPKVSRVAGLGIVTLAKHSGCPIVPVAMATSRRLRLSNWDRTAINLPFGRMVMVRGEPIRVPRDADDAALEAARRLVEERLNGVTAHAYSVADGTEIAGQAKPMDDGKEAHELPRLKRRCRTDSTWCLLIKLSKDEHTTATHVRQSGGSSKTAKTPAALLRCSMSLLPITTCSPAVADGRFRRTTDSHRSSAPPHL